VEERASAAGGPVHLIIAGTGSLERFIEGNHCPPDYWRGRWFDEQDLPVRRGYVFGRHWSVSYTRWVSLECGGLTPLSFAVA